jgi:hypothetical protein
MDDYSVTSLIESKNEWCARLVGIFTPAVISGIHSIFNEAVTMCDENNEKDKYLLSFQTFLKRVPKWNKTIIETEYNRIANTSGCSYIEDLVTCVHIIQLKALTCIRVGQEQKKVDVDVPSVEDFIHKIYISVARKVYSNVYLFDIDVTPLQIQRHNRELEIIIRECIMDTIRSSMPVEEILRTYLAETQEEETDIREEIIDKPIPKEEAVDENIETEKVDTFTEKVDTSTKKVDTSTENVDTSTENVDTFTENVDTSTENAEKIINVETKSVQDNQQGKLSFSDVDKALTSKGIEVDIEAPKNVDRLEEISTIAYKRRKAEEDEEDDDDDDMPLRIGEEVRLELEDVNDISKPMWINSKDNNGIEYLS